MSWQVTLRLEGLRLGRLEIWGAVDVLGVAVRSTTKQDERSRHQDHHALNHRIYGLLGENHAKILLRLSEHRFEPWIPALGRGLGIDHQAKNLDLLRSR
jgi:hypothetical protein